MIEFIVETSGRDDMVDITGQVASAIRELGIEDGMVLVWVPHTTAAVTINEGADPDVPRDMRVHVSKPSK